MNAPRPARAGQRGVTMTEVLVAIVVFATGLLGIANLQSHALRLNQAAVVRTQAVLAANNVLDRMRANRSAAADYVIAVDADAPSGDTVAAADLAEWRRQLATALPSGSGSVSLDATGNVTVVIRWEDFDDSSVQLAERDAATAFEFRTRL